MKPKKAKEFSIRSEQIHTQEWKIYKLECITIIIQMWKGSQALQQKIKSRKKLWCIFINQHVWWECNVMSRSVTHICNLLRINII